MIVPDFSQLDLTETEGKLYLSLLELGGGYASTIAKRAALPRVNCYHTLDNLVKKGLVNIVSKGHARYFVPEPPQVLANVLEEKAEYAKSILPDLLSITNTLSFKPAIRTFEGIDGVNAVLDATLKTHDKLLGYSNLKAKGELYEKTLRGYGRKLMEHAIRTRIICPSSMEAFSFVSDFYPPDFPTDLVEILFVNPREFWFENEILIFDDTVAIVSLNREEPLALLIESPSYARSQRAIFNLAWLGASSFIVQ